MTSKERLICWKRRTAQRALVGSADNVRYQSDERSARLARLGVSLTKGRDKRVTEKRLAAVLAARRRRKGQSPGGALPVGLYPYSPEGNKTRVATILAQPYGRRP